MPTADLRPGAAVHHPTRLGKYTITEVLGEGAMGVVYRGFDPDIQRPVALKTIRRALVEGTEQGMQIAARFRNEAQAAGRLSHPGIVAVYDYAEDQGVAFIAMEFVEGRSLAAYLAQPLRFGDADIPGLVTQLLDALHHAHERGVWHRDVKPANVILARNAQLKVADFGVARIESAELTRMNAVIGTPSYMAPEQFLGHAIDRRVDIYAVGVLLYTLLVGRPPFAGSTEALMYKVVHEAPVLPSAVEGANRPPFYDALLAKALAKDPAQRYATAAEFKTAVEAAVGDYDPTAWERTVVAAPLPAARPGPQRPGSGASQGAASFGSLATHWDRAELKPVQDALARHLGPLAAVLVNRAARDCADLPSLVARLADELPDAAARAAFLRETSGSMARATAAGAASAAASAAAPPAAPAPAVGTAPPALDAALLEAARRLLAGHLGPIAGLIVKRAVSGAADRAAFFDALARNVDDPAARKRLLDDLARLK